MTIYLALSGEFVAQQFENVPIENGKQKLPKFKTSQNIIVYTAICSSSLTCSF